ncbi:hypothetical protein TNCV_890821 [Trichonephila clavipes]|nr:hypothetical protein TNCV_890821 [Trichonephila clavipes]
MGFRYKTCWTTVIIAPLSYLEIRVSVRSTTYYEPEYPYTILLNSISCRARSRSFGKQSLCLQSFGSGVGGASRLKVLFECTFPTSHQVSEAYQPKKYKCLPTF